jgi:hypothetical protein
MKKEELQGQSNLVNSTLDRDFRDLFAMSFTTLNISEGYSQIYKRDPSFAIPKRLIELYVKHIKPDYNRVIFNFKRKYVYNEALVEKNDTKEQKKGLGLVYDFIQEYNINEPLNIFVATMKISNLLWKPTDDKNNSDLLEEQKQLRKRIEELSKEAREQKDLAKFRESRELQRKLESLSHKTRIGGCLRSSNSEDEVKLYDTDIAVPSASEAMTYMNSYLQPEKQEEFYKILKDSNIIKYISYCVKEMCNMIYYQPFMDGNKRTARAILNLMFKVRGLPPVYIQSREREEYKKALFKGIKYKDYKDIIGFYLFKICDSIYELDIKPYKDQRLGDFEKELNDGLYDILK